MSIKIALAGNPNCGKTTLFNALTGSNQFVGNWPGVTVEKKEGKLKGHKDVTIMDLPGIYSLSPYTLEEVVARNYLINERPDAIINIVDGTNIERNLYLSTQIMELGIPVIMAVNMVDIMEKNGDKVDLAKLGKNLGCEAVEISALKGTGIKEAAEKIVAAGAKSVVIKGGERLSDNSAIDIFYDGKEFTEMAVPKIYPSYNHGAGCTFSAAITAGLANVLSMKEAVLQAKKFVTAALKHGFAINNIVGCTNHTAYRKYSE